VEQVVALDPANTHLRDLQKTLSAPSQAAGAAEADADMDHGAMATDPAAVAEENNQGAVYALPICGISE
jgi:hypothetical protein